MLFRSAKTLGYTPRTASCASALVNATIISPTSTPDVATIPALQPFTTIVDNKTYTFYNLEDVTIAKSGTSSYVFQNLEIVEGTPLTYTYTVIPGSRFVIPNQNMCLRTLSVSMQETATSDIVYTYNLSDDLTKVTSESRVYFLKEIDGGLYEITFGDGVIGKALETGNVVTLSYFVSSLGEPNGASTFTYQGANVLGSNLSTVTTTAAFGGGEVEDITSIKFNAPRMYAAQNRAVTVKDYETILLKDYNNIDAVSIWGGEDNDPVVYGKVYMALKTKGYYSLSNLEKERIKTTLIENRNILTVVPEIVDPEYVFVQVRGKVYYNPSITTKTAEEISTLAVDAVLNYNERELTGFKSVFRKSKLQYYIENADPSITGSDIEIFMQRRVPITINAQKNYVVRFNSELRKGDFENKFSTYPQIKVVDANKAFKDVFFEEVPDSFTGVDRIDVTNAGINYTYAPTVTIVGDGTGAAATATVVGGRITKITITSKGTNYTRATVTISGDGSEAGAVAVLEARIGTLRSYYFKDNGEKVIVNTDAGTINYDTGEISLTSLTAYEVIQNDFYDSDILAINVSPAGEVIHPSRQRIIAIDYRNKQSINIDTIAES